MANSELDPDDRAYERRRRRGRSTAADVSGKAIASLILGGLSLFTCFLLALPGLAAMLFGGLALMDIRRGRGRLSGQGLAVGGIVSGGVSTVLFMLLVLAGVLFTRNMTNQVETQLRDNPLLVKHLGPLPRGSFSFDMLASMREDEQDVWVYRVRGPLGEGRVIVETETVDFDNEVIHWAKLRLPSGEEVDLVLEKVPKP